MTAVDTTIWKLKKLDIPPIQGWAINPCGTMLAAVVDTDTLHIYRTEDWQLLTQMRVGGEIYYDYGRGLRWITDTLLRVKDISTLLETKDASADYKYDDYLFELIVPECWPGELTNGPLLKETPDVT